MFLFRGNHCLWGHNPQSPWKRATSAKSCMVGPLRLLLTEFYGTTLQASKSEVRFKLSGLLAAHQPTAQHQCKLSVEIKTAKQFSDKIQQFQSCTKTITTYHGDFRDPCKQKGTMDTIHLYMKYTCLQST